MHSDEEIISFMDLLDLDEEVIDLRAKSLMEKSTFTLEHLNNFINLLQYKQLINIREDSECDNEAEYHFLGKLITNINDENVHATCKIINTVLTLNPSTIIFKSEHLIQQILAEICLPTHTNIIRSEIEVDKLTTTLLHLKICGSILDANKNTNSKLSLPFLSTPLENILCSNDEKLVIYFLTNTVPRFFTNVEGYNILDRIWDFLKELTDAKGMIALRVICCLSNYYLPVTDSSTTIESHIISENKFWHFILLGLNSEDAFARKQSIYLAKRVIDYIMNNKKNVSVTSKTQFLWKDKNKINLKKMWDNFFVLLDSLEEKQSNIVLPSLKLFELVTDIGRCWLNCAFNIGLKHDNTQVRLKCLHYHLQFGVQNESEAIIILKAINDIILFDHEYKSLLDKLNEVLKDNASLMRILKSLPLIKWSPVPLYYVTKIISNFDGSLSFEDQTILLDLISDLSKIPCNNVIIRKCIHINLSHLVGKCCKDLNWRKYIPVYSCLQIDNTTESNDSLVENPFKKIIKKNINIPQEDKVEFFKLISISHANIDFALLYFEEHNSIDFLDFIDGIMHRIEDISKRQYSDKAECLKDVIFVVYLYSKSLHKNGGIYDKINNNATKFLKILLRYIMSMLISDVIFDIESITCLFENLDQLVTQISNVNEIEILSELYKSTILCLQDENTIVDKKVLSIYVLCSSLKSPLMLQNYKQYYLDIKNIMEIILNVNFIGNLNKENTGRLRNSFYEKSCEIVNNLLNRDDSQDNNILCFIEVVIESGGYGCLKWILRIMNRILSTILEDKNIKFDVIQFLNRMWTEIEELKSNSQYPICMKEFVNLITQHTLLDKSMYNNIVLMYCSKIIEYAAVKNLPLYLLVNQLNKINVHKYSHMVYVLSEILLNPIISKKENRIIENVLLEILQEPIYGANKHCIYFNSHIQFLAVSILSKISDPEELNSVTYFMIKKIDELFKNKQRYHSNSQLQRTLQACVQNLLFILLKSRKVNFQSTALWCMAFLGRIPHQPFERTCLEWYISLYFYLKETVVNEDILNQLKSNNVPLSSQFTIMYWIVMHKLKHNICLSQEYEFLMDFLLSHIMGPVFSIRLQAQYLSSMLYEANEISKNKLDTSRYAYMIKVINGTLQEIANVEDKSFKRLKNDYFVVNFDIVEDLIPCEIYWVLPQLVNALSNDIIEDGFLRNILSDIEGSLNLDENDKFHNEWKEKRRKNTDVLQFTTRNKIIRKEVENLEETGTIQKKYVPWKNMSDIDVYNNENKSNKTELIVVASLIDKLPNLGGMARTSEVFGVRTYVVDSLWHLQDKQFQGLSVSAERWVPVEEVRPGQALRDYLLRQKAAGYCVVAAEQTSTSTKLQNFRFPHKTLLLLGNEKEGVPCDLLPLMDHCVEIPQQGVIRSLNVHVTAAIFIWEYTKQNVL